MMRRLTVLALLLLCAGLLAGCGTAVPRNPATIRGVVTSVATTEDRVTVRVVWHQDSGALLELDAADITIGPDAKVLTSRGTSRDRAAATPATTIAVRDLVEVWITGPVRESYPVQADAKVVLIYGTLKADVPLPFPRGLEPEPVP